MDKGKLIGTRGIKNLIETNHQNNEKGTIQNPDRTYVNIYTLTSF